MYRVTTWDNLGDLDYELDAIQDGLADLRPLGEEVAELMREDNLESRMAGLDRTGSEFADLADSTIRKRQQRGEFGVTPFVGRGGAATIIEAFQVDVTSPEPWIVVVTGGWPGVPWIKYHVELLARAGRLPLRDFLGVSPGYDELIHDRIFAYLGARARGE